MALPKQSSRQAICTLGGVPRRLGVCGRLLALWLGVGECWRYHCLLAGTPPPRQSHANCRWFEGAVITANAVKERGEKVSVVKVEKRELKVDDTTDLTLQERIAKILADRIIRGVLKPGERLRQDMIAGEFNISHVPVREAFRRLESQGLVHSEPRKGVRVAHLDEASIVEITKMRAALETLALRLAVPHITDEDLSDAAAAIERSKGASSIEEWESCNRAFHGALTRPCGMPRLLRTIEELHVARLRYMYATTTSNSWDPQSQQEHCQILDAVRHRDVEAACGLIEQHVLESADVVIDVLRHRHEAVDSLVDSLT